MTNDQVDDAFDRLRQIAKPGGACCLLQTVVLRVLALEIVNQFAISTAFIGASGITDEALTVADYNEAQLKAAIIKRTQKVIVPIDCSKVGFVDFARVCQPRDVDIIVTVAAGLGGAHSRRRRFT